MRQFQICRFFALPCRRGSFNKDAFDTSFLDANWPKVLHVVVLGVVIIDAIQSCFPDGTLSVVHSVLVRMCRSRFYVIFTLGRIVLFLYLATKKLIDDAYLFDIFPLERLENLLTCIRIMY